jgi:hypothetical protein
MNVSNISIVVSMIAWLTVKVEGEKCLAPQGREKCLTPQGPQKQGRIALYTPLPD